MAGGNICRLEEKNVKKLRRFIVVLCVVFMFVVPVSAADADTHVFAGVTTRNTGVLLVEVRNARDNTPISGARVTLLSQNGSEVGLIGVSDTEGKVLPEYELAPGKYTLRTVKSGYRTKTTDIEMTPALELKVTVLLSRSSSGGDGGSTGGGTGDLPRTGGSWDMMMYFVLLLFNSALLFVLILLYKRGTRKE